MLIGGHRARTTLQAQPTRTQRRGSLLGGHRQQAPLNNKVEIRNNEDLRAFQRDPIGIITQKTFGTEQVTISHEGFD